jgi:hypothetical protein
MMRKRLLCSVGVLALALGALSATLMAQRQLLQYVPRCRHDDTAIREDRDRRAQALVLARAINAAQAELVRLKGEYQPQGNLGSLPSAPRDFELTLYANHAGYIFSLKDTVDPCHFAVFSDASGLIYEQSALEAPAVAR